MNRVYLITDAPPRRIGWRGVGRGVWAVLVLLFSAVDHYLTALAGVPPLAWCARQVARAIRDAYLQGRHGPSSACTEVEQAVYDAEIVGAEPSHWKER